MSELAECPRCTKKSLVQRGHDLYECLNCDFKRDFSKPVSNSSSSDITWLLYVVIVTIILVLMQRQPSSQSPVYSPLPQSSEEMPPNQRWN